MGTDSVSSVKYGLISNVQTKRASCKLILHVNTARIAQKFKLVSLWPLSMC